MPVLGVIAGLAREAACLDVFPPDARPRIAVTGARPAEAARAARALLDQGCDALLSFGLCGGLDPALAAGSIVLADRVVTVDGANLPTDHGWLAALETVLAGELAPLAAAVCGSDRPVLESTVKSTLFAATGAVVIDMESHEVGRAAKERGVPFLAVRAVADAAGRDVPPAALAGIAVDGTVRPGPVVAAMLLRPWQAPALMALARDTQTAFAALGRVAVLGGPLFALR